MTVIARPSGRGQRKRRGGNSGSYAPKRPTRAVHIVMPLHKGGHGLPHGSVYKTASPKLEKGRDAAPGAL